jgi:2-dehydro-3-deoxygalactonokinase
MQDHFLSCDWGTSNFRLRLVASADLRVVREVASDKGVGELAKAWRAKNSNDEPERIAFYMSVLREHVAEIMALANEEAEGAPIVISGMASSTIGLVSLPYRHLPVPVDGSGLNTKLFARTGDFPHDLLLISGLQSDDDVMRGEETQLVGCMTPEMERHAGKQLVIHPGTHSKHIIIEGKQISSFSTYMSGELFKLLTTHGILLDNVVANPMGETALPHFAQGVRDSLGETLLHAAFKVRTNDLFGKMSKEDNYHYLSGLLIGSELQELRQSALKMYLCCGPGLFQQYNTALRVLDLDKKVIVFPPEWEEGAVVRGQAKILSKLRGVESGIGRQA